MTLTGRHLGVRPWRSQEPQGEDTGENKPVANICRQTAQGRGVCREETRPAWAPPFRALSGSVSTGLAGGLDVGTS